MIVPLILSAMVLATPPGATDAATTTTTAAADAPVIRKRIPVTGSMQGRRECHTRADWDLASRETARKHDPDAFRAGPAPTP